MLKKREQLKEESQREMEERTQGLNEAKRLANMKETIEGRNDVKLMRMC